VNILLLIIAMKVLGPKFGIKTIFAIIVGSVFLGIMQPLMPVDGILPDEKFMSTIIAAMLTGIGIGVSALLLVEVPEVRISLRCW